MEKGPLVSVIMPIYNAEKYVAEALAGVSRQDYAPLQIIVIDDGSTDSSLEIIKASGADIEILSQANAGPAAARNSGLARAEGEFIAFIDADDIWADNKLSGQLAYLAAHPAVDIVIGRSKYFGDFSARDKKLALDEEQTAVAFNVGSALFRRSAFTRVGQFDETLRYSEDYDWFLRAREKGLAIQVLSEVALHRRMHQESMTHAQEAKNYQLPLMLKKSLDRRRRAGMSGSLPDLPFKE